MDPDPKIRDQIFDLFQEVSENEHLKNGWQGSEIINEINNYLKYNASSRERFKSLLEHSSNRLSPAFTSGYLISLIVERLTFTLSCESPRPSPPKPRKKTSTKDAIEKTRKINRASKRPKKTRSPRVEDFDSSASSVSVGSVSTHSSRKSSKAQSRSESAYSRNESPTESLSGASTLVNSQVTSRLTTEISEPHVSTRLNNSLDAVPLENSEHDNIVKKRKQIKQWLFTLIKEYSKIDKDGGIRHQKVDALVLKEHGFKDFKCLCIDSLGYQSVEHFILHCGSPQIKLAKHKTTGKGATKCGEWVFQEHLYYEGKDKISHNHPYKIPEEYFAFDWPTSPAIAHC